MRDDDFARQQIGTLADANCREESRYAVCFARRDAAARQGFAIPCAARFCGFVRDRSRAFVSAVVQHVLVDESVATIQSEAVPHKRQVNPSLVAYGAHLQ